MNTAGKIAALRRAMRKAGVHAFLVPSADPHQSEYVPDCWARREWTSGFTGSAGELVVTRRAAGLWTDARYFLQAEMELNGSGIDLHRMGRPDVPGIEEYLAGHMRRGERVGMDPRTVSGSRAESLRSALDAVGAELVALDENLVDAVWNDQPALPAAPLAAWPKRFSGEAVAARLQRVRAAMNEAGATAHVVTMLDAIAWLFNVRGRDVDFNPVAIAYALVTADEATLFVDAAKLTPAVRRHLEPQVTVVPYERFGPALVRLARRRGTVWVDPASASAWVMDCLTNARLHRAPSPIARMKARKNEVELDGMRRAHVRDGVAVTRFLAWLEDAVPNGGVTELGAADRLESFRREGEYFQGLSFPTISGYGPHGAVIHYSVSPESDIPIEPRGLYLVDSGAQYLDGTTDITRTVAIGGKVSRAEADAYTRVLKGHIALATAQFPLGATGARLDTLARQFLWAAGLDFDHGTGHGVGAYLNVHEGPQSISPRISAALEVGNIQSNEPGYYKDGRFGIRIENLVEVVDRKTRGDAHRRFLGLDTLTVCPIDTRPIRADLMTDAERRWLNAYHRRVRRTLSPLLEPPVRRWLSRACRAI